MKVHESELDEKVSAVADRLESESIDGTQAVTTLREATGLPPCIAAGLLKREMCRRREQAVARLREVARGVLREVGRDDEGRWTQ